MCQGELGIIIRDGNWLFGRRGCFRFAHQNLLEFADTLRSVFRPFWHPLSQPGALAPLVAEQFFYRTEFPMSRACRVH